MKEQPEALRLAEDLEIDYFGDVVAHNAAAELRRLAAVEAEMLAMRRVFSEAGCTFDVAYIRRLLRAEAASCSNTFDCQCPKHFASQQSEQRPKRVLTAVWRDRAQRAEAQRDALLEALGQCLNGTLIGGHTHNDNGLEVLAERCGSPHVAAELRRLAGIARAAIKAVEEEA